jgi:hypothetical protein
MAAAAAMATNEIHARIAHPPSPTPPTIADMVARPHAPGLARGRGQAALVSAQLGLAAPALVGGGAVVGLLARQVF